MGVFNKVFPKDLSGLAIGVGMALVAPVLLVATASLLRPLAKTAIKGGFILRDAAVGLCGAAGQCLAGQSPHKPEAEPAPLAEPPKPEKKSEPVPEPPRAEAKPRKTETVKTKKS